MSLERVGPYRVEREVGRGAMGVVFLARDERLDRQVALKSLPAAVATNERRLARFEREARLLASMSHPNIAHLYALEEVAGERFLVMEWVPGRTLGELLLERRLELAEALDLCAQVARGVAAAHTRGVVHRDLKPTNIRVTPDGVAKVLDFGVAKGVSAWDTPAPDDDASLMAWGPAGEEGAGEGGTGERGGDAGGPERIQTGAGRIVGTPGYMSPEQARGREVDHRGDVWSLGCIIYECATGRRAFPGETPMDLIAATLARDPAWEPLRAIGAPGLVELVQGALEREPDARISSVEIVVDRLVRIDTTTIERDDDGADEGTGLVGRDEVLASVRRGLEAGRVVTLVGFGGVGKTSVAMDVARRTTGAVVVELAELDEAEANAALNDQLREGDFRVVVIDNAEHASGAVRAHAERCALGGAAVLVTSREALGIAGEAVVAVEPLAVPAAGEQRVGVIGRSPAVELFAKRLASLRPGFELDRQNASLVAQVCQRVRGLPLAIELAAERAAVMPLDELDRRLAGSLAELIGRDARPDRQRTLASLVEWGWRLLEPAQRTALARLAALDGPFDAELARWMLDAPEVTALDPGP